MVLTCAPCAFSRSYFSGGTPSGFNCACAAHGLTGVERAARVQARNAAAAAKGKA